MEKNPLTDADQNDHRQKRSQTKLLPIAPDAQKPHGPIRFGRATCASVKRAPGKRNQLFVAHGIGS